MNFTQIAGHLGSNPEERRTPDGRKVTNFSIAVRSRKKGEDVTIWYRVAVWGDRFDRMLVHLKKGSPVIVSGELQKPEIYTNRDGEPQVSLEVTADNIRFSPFGRAEQQEEMQQSAPQTSMSGFQAEPVGAAPSGGISDNDLPF